MPIAAGTDDHWSSTRDAINILRTRTDAGLEIEVRGYPEAGHDLVGDGGPPEAARSGGTPEADAAARQDVWPKVLDFLRLTLRP